MNAAEWRAVIALGAVYLLRMIGRQFMTHDPAGRGGALR